MKKYNILKIVFGVVFFVLWAVSAFAQLVDTAWVRTYTGPGSLADTAYAIAVDDSGNVYVTGQSSGTSYDYATIKYYPNGDTAWVRIYNGPANYNDGADAITVDSSGNVYVTGYSDGSGTYEDYATIKYYPNGFTTWVGRYDGPGYWDDRAKDIAIDGSGNVYVTGYSDGSGTSYDYATVKYYPNGFTAWVGRYDGPANWDDGAHAITVDGSGNVYVTGYSDGGETMYDYATIKYYPNGDTAWVRRYNGPGNWDDGAFAIAVDDSGNVYVTGESYGSGTSYDYATIKYYPNGNTAWVTRYNGPGNYNDGANAIAVDDSGNVYVTGYSRGAGSSDDYATLKYYPNGNTAWVTRYNGPGNYNDGARAIAVDDSGNVYVTGYSRGGGTSDDYATIKYVQPGTIAGMVRDEMTRQYVQGVQVIALQGTTVRGGATTDSIGQYIIPNLWPGTYDVRASRWGYITQTQLGIEVVGLQTTRVNFELIRLPGVDLSVDLWGDTRPRPGFQKSYAVSYINNRGDDAESVVLSVRLPEEVLFVSCDPPTCSVNGRDISWNLVTVPGLSQDLVGITFSVPVSVTIGTVLSGTAEIATTSGDLILRNNWSEEEEVVVGSRDPNNKEAQPWGGGSAKYIMPDQPVRYTIFFENDTSATAEAIYIDIVDTLDPNLDWLTLEIGPMSHPDTCEASFDPISGVLSWHCDSIMLPPNHNPPEGEGFISFSVLPDSGLAFGAQIKNRAHIRFDYNPWIPTPESGPVIRTIGRYGDVNGDGLITVSDVVYLINYLFKGGPPPAGGVMIGDINCDGKVTVSDVVYLINYLFRGGPPPC